MGALALETLEQRILPASSIFWNMDQSGDWNTASNWVDDQGVSRVPAAGDNVANNRRRR